MMRGAPFAIIFAGLANAVLISFPILSIPVCGIVIFFICQKGPDIKLSAVGFRVADSSSLHVEVPETASL
jgi:hypothetical protein